MKQTLSNAFLLGAAALGSSHPAMAAIADTGSRSAPAAWVQSAGESMVSMPASARTPMILAAGPRDRLERRQDHRENSSDRVEDKQDHREDRRDCTGNGADCRSDNRQDNRGDSVDRAKDRADDRRERR